MPQTSRRPLIEESYQPPAKAERNLDRVRELLKQGIVEDVKLMGFNSKNKNRRYLEEGIDAALYDGKPCNIDHPHVTNPNDPAEMRRAVRAPRPFLSRFGKFEEPYKVAGDGLYAKRLRFNTKHPLAEAFCGWVIEMPEMVGFSPAQFGDVYETADGEVVERVTEVKVIELVGDPATTRGILEGAMCEGDDPDKDKKKDPLLEDDDEGLMDDDLPGVGDDDLADDVPADDAASDDDAGAGIDITPEIFTAIEKVCQAHLSGQMEMAEAVKKIKQLFATHAAIAESVMPNAPTPKNSSDAVKLLARVATRIKSKPVREALKLALLENRDLRGKQTRVTREEQAKALLKDAKLPAEVTENQGFLEELLDCRDKQRMLKKIDFWRSVFGTRRDAKPKSASQVGLTEAERREAEQSLRGGNDTQQPLSDEEIKKRQDAFAAKYGAAARVR